MNQYGDIFGMTRIPGKVADTQKIARPSNAKHIIVMTRDQIYKMPVLHEDGSRASLAELQRYIAH